MRRQCDVDRSCAIRLLPLHLLFNPPHSPLPFLACLPCYRLDAHLSGCIAFCPFLSLSSIPHVCHFDCLLSSPLPISFHILHSLYILSTLSVQLNTRLLPFCDNSYAYIGTRLVSFPCDWDPSDIIYPYFLTSLQQTKPHCATPQHINVMFLILASRIFVSWLGCSTRYNSMRHQGN